MFSHFLGRIPLFSVKLHASHSHLEEPTRNAWLPGRDREEVSQIPPQAPEPSDKQWMRLVINIRISDQ